MKIEIQINNNERTVIHETATSTYIKDDMYCVCDIDSTPLGIKVYKYPISRIFRVIENY